MLIILNTKSLLELGGGSWPIKIERIKLGTVQDWLSVWILFPDLNIKHDQCKGNWTNFYFNQVVLAEYKYLLSQSIAWNDWTDWLTELSELIELN